MKVARIFLIRLVITGIFFLAGCGEGSGMHKPVSEIDNSASTGSGGAVSYSQIAPIIQARCVRCHNNGSMDWTNETNLIREAKSGTLAQKISTKEMPMPGSPEAASITQDERNLIIAWANSVASPNPGPGGTSPGPAPSAPSDGPDVIHDRNLSIVVQCAACHGMNGLSIGSDIPNLAGHTTAYFNTRLTGFLLSSSASPMSSILKGILGKYKELSYTVGIGSDGQSIVTPNADLNDVFNYIAAYFSNQQVLPRADDFKNQQAAFTKDQKELFSAGQKVLTDNQCVACHLQPDFRPLGAAGAPMIFGQKADYLTRRFAEFKSGKGGNTMPGLVSALSANDIKALVFFLSHVHPTQVQPSM